MLSLKLSDQVKVNPARDIIVNKGPSIYIAPICQVNEHANPLQYRKLGLLSFFFSFFFNILRIQFQYYIIVQCLLV